jgi:amino acid permease
MATSYVCPILFISSFVIHKILNKTKAVKPEDADFETDKAEIDREEQEFLRQDALKADLPTTFWAKLYSHSLGYVF